MLNVWCLFCSLAGTHLIAKWGRKPTAILSEVLLVICLFIIGGLSKIYADHGDATSGSVVYGDVAVMFLFQGFYSIAWTPLLYLYPPEVMNYSIRANGVAFSQLGLNAFAYAITLMHSDREGAWLTLLQTRLRLHHAHRARQHRVEDVHGQR